MSSLDDFFAKRDKKKGKDKSKSILTPDDLVKELEEGSTRQPDYHARKDGSKLGIGIDILGLNGEDADDWKDFEEVEKRDYTGLKIQTISLEDQEEEIRRQQAAERRENDQEVAWKPAQVAIASASNQTDSKSESKSESKTEASNKDGDVKDGEKPSTSEDKSSENEKKELNPPEPKKPQPYIAPHRQAQMAKGVIVLEPSPLPMGNRRLGARQTETVIDLASSEAFPTLG